MELTPEERSGIEKSRYKLALAITPYFFNLIDQDNPDCPMRLQVIPRVAETVVMPFEKPDPLGEDGHMVVPGLVHRYPDRVLFLVTDRCAAYCRYCTRSRMVSNSQNYDFMPNYREAVEYIRDHREIRDVLLSGGDPLLLSDEKVEWLLKTLREIDHVEFLRIGTRIPVFLPQRITPGLTSMLKKYHPLWISVHVNHPAEATLELKEACERLADAGIPLGNQSVLIHKVNDDANVMKELVHKLLMMRVRPYILYQMDPIEGSSHFRVPVAKGLEIIERLRGHTTGYAVPQYVIDAPGGGGKVPINPNYLVEWRDENIILRNYENKLYVYKDGAATGAFEGHS